MKRFIILVLDSFGIGEMADVRTERPQDMGANTYRSVLRKNPHLKLENLQKLGLANAAGLEIGEIHFQNGANFGTSNLKHFGCDTFYGHHELMGTDPKKPVEEPFKNNIESVEKALIGKGYQVQRFGEGEKVLLVDDAISIGDNLEADLGQVYNVTGSFQKITYEELLQVGKIVRDIVKVPRVIAFGGTEATIETIKAAYKSKREFAGVSAPLSKVYEAGYKVLHMGYGIDSHVQLPTIIGEEIPVTLIGKVADIVANPHGKSYPEVDSEEVMKILIENIKREKKSF
ncbi:MAG: phosphopentomutase, partial [Fusobacteriaceae bacterium]